jgi:hypothetical protein
MPDITVQRLRPTTPHLAPLEAKIIAQRNEYASWDLPEYQHIYLGFVEGSVADLLNVLAVQITLTRAEFPAATFMLEYHPSCITHTEYPFQVYSFTLIKSLPTSSGLTRQLMIMSWVLPHQADYHDENAAIEAFMMVQGVQPYDDGSGEVCKLEPAWS